nr:MAG: hypothetical protein CM15mP61_05220 [Gammaproteobacteria bacterium]
MRGDLNQMIQAEINHKSTIQVLKITPKRILNTKWIQMNIEEIPHENAKFDKAFNNYEIFFNTYFFLIFFSHHSLEVRPMRRYIVHPEQ